jgi:hypothetical protein
MADGYGTFVSLGSGFGKSLIIAGIAYLELASVVKATPAYAG